MHIFLSTKSSSEWRDDSFLIRNRKPMLSKLTSDTNMKEKKEYFLIIIYIYKKSTTLC